MTDRNPSPPPEIDENAECKEDFIGESAVSKTWLFKALVNMAQEATSHKDEEADAVDISDEVEYDCCTLWDLSADKDIALFMNENQCFKIIAGILSQSKAPRLTEVCTGILANVACYDEACCGLTEIVELRRLIVSMFSCRDAPTLVETVRLLRGVLCNANTKQLWMTSIKENEQVYEDVTFILKNSCNGKLLSFLLEVVSTLIDESSSLLQLYTKVEVIESVIEAGKQILADKELCCDKPYAVGSSLHVIQSIATNETTNIELGDLVDKLLDLCKCVCGLWCEHDCEVLTSSLDNEAFTQEDVAIISLLSLLGDVEDVKKLFLKKDESSLHKVIKHIHAHYEGKTTEDEASPCLIQQLSCSLMLALKT